MKKVININFQGRVIPIEETAYDKLQHYISSLRIYFANEEGRDEIINDIENRIAELFGESLKKGTACITDVDIEQIMSSMGRPEDFEQEAAFQSEGEPRAYSNEYANQGLGSQAYAESETDTGSGKKRLYRDEEDKIIGGVASGLANYLNIDPAVIRIIFALLAIFGGSGVLIYIILWIVLPSRSLVTNIRKRLYRDPDDKVISGVCSGLAKYFDINPAIPRIIFAAPFIFGIITSVGRTFFDPGPVFIGSFGGGTFILVYIILWIVLPEAHTAAEKLEMRGEKVDLNSIRDTVMSDLQGVKTRAQKMGKEFAESAQRIGGEMKETFAEKGQQMSSEIGQATRKHRRGIGNALAILVKAFIYFIGGIIAFSLFVALIALLGTGVGVLPLKDFLLQGFWQNFFAWGTLVLFLGIPAIALLVWFIRRLMRVRNHNKFIGYSFTTLWFAGLFCFIALLASLSRGFSTQVAVRDDISIEQPSSGKLEVKLAGKTYTYYSNWYEWDGITSVNADSLYINTARVQVVRSNDSLYRVHLVRASKGREREQAQRLAEKIDFKVESKDGVLYLPETFAVSRNDKWRNQRVTVVIEVPAGKEIRIDDRVGRYEYFDIEFGNRRRWRTDWEADWNDTEDWRYERDMLMTPDGLEWEGRSRRNNRNRNDEYEMNQDRITPPVAPGTDSVKPALPDTTYRYRQTGAVEASFLPAIKAATTPLKHTSFKKRIVNPLAMVMMKI